MKAVAEGVETLAQRSMLDELGCDHGQGYLWSRSRPTLDLTAAPTELMTRQHGPPAAPTPSARRVILVDDATPERSLVRHLLERDGAFTVIGEAGRADQALTLIGDLRTDLALLDLSLPDRSGLEIIRLILDASPTTQVVVYSGFVSTGVEHLALDEGAVSCIDKSTPPDALIDILLLLEGATLSSTERQHV
jgi:CheY-like chemotaxis protein